MGTERAERNPNIGLSYEIEVYDKDGNLKEHREEEAHCFVKNFLMSLMSFHMNSGETIDPYAPVNITTVTGAVVMGRGAVAVAGAQTRVGGFPGYAGVGDDVYGIQVGTGSTPTGYDDYTIESKIPHGTADGCLEYDATLFPGVYDSEGSMIIPIRRMFTNATAADIAISELAFVTKFLQTNGTVNYMLHARDVLPVPTTLAPGESAVVIYKIRVN